MPLANPARASSAIAALLLAAMVGPWLAVSTAHAHEFWLAPSRYRAAIGETLAVQAWVGTGFRGERKPYAAPRAHRLVMRNERERDLKQVAAHGDLAFVRWVVGDPGGASIGYESDFASVVLEPRPFDAYLETEGLEAARRTRARLGARAGAGRERYARCPKTWVAGTDPARATRPLGLTFEIIPETDPTPDGPLAVRLLFRGRPVADVLVRAWRTELAAAASPRDAATRDSVGPVVAVRTDRSGRARLPIKGSGEWLISGVHMTPCSDRGLADWESWWASLTFARTAP
ncbi:MAG: DUF4198 domain-containing protein [Candidatus Eisenbacteria bacterium]|uniref:DUF4198 domain-containing protein n=1 Tax=Eiseniibacteriota bacterium TaxID=2212470 RepID=A0A849SPN6_UNCEI|nr:DUF4198 domain-containing protein [Candidatus Eisenbacteria bacterium]